MSDFDDTQLLATTRHGPPEDIHEQYNERLVDAIESISEAFVLYDSAGKLVLCNQQHLEFFPHLVDLYQPGVSREDVLRHHAAIIRKSDPDFDVDAYIEDRLQRINTPREDKQSQLSDGRWVSTRERSVKGGGIVSIRSDITLIKQAELEITNHRDCLQVMVTDATAELNRRANKLKTALRKERELNRLQSEFVSMVSHEFRTPLTIIDMTAQRLKSHADKGRLTPDDAVMRVKKIRDAVQRMTRLMESTLSAARIEEGKINIEIGECDLRYLVLEVLMAQIELSPTHNIISDLQDLPDSIQADSGVLTQIFTNLLSNAVKYAPDAPDIKIAGHTEEGQVVISVRDHGIGIDEDELDRIGERFFRAKTSIGIAGTGIGLNLAKMLIKRHDGTINVESRKGEGATFIIRLPIDGPDQTEQADTKVA